MEYVKTGIKTLDTLLPNGIPRDNFIGLFGEGGTGKSVILYEIFYNRLATGEPGIYICLEDIPPSIMRHMENFGWDISQFTGCFKFLDCYSFRMGARKSSEIAEIVRQPSDLDSLTDALFDMMDELNMEETGIVVVDSLTELMITSNVPEMVDMVKDWRAKGPKAKSVTFISSVHYGLDIYKNVVETFDYIMDGLIDLRYDPGGMKKGYLLKELRIRKMKGTVHKTNWTPFEITGGGMKTIETDEKDPEKR